MALWAVVGSGCHCGGKLQSITGEGVLNPTKIDFGDVVLGQPPINQGFTLKNVGPTTLTIVKATFTGANFGDFSLSLTLDGKQLQPEQTLSRAIGFAPLDAGARSATLHLETDSRTTPTIDLPLTGNGVDVQLCPQPGTIDFGQVQVLGTPAQQTLTINNCGKSPTDVTVGSPQGAQASDFQVSGTTTGHLQPGDTLTLQVSFSPQQVGPSSASLPVQACATCAASAPVGLGGVGIDGALTFSPSPAAFGTVNTGQTGDQTVTVTNSGTATISLTALNVQGNPSPFALPAPPTFPLSLTPGQTTTVSVSFAPTVAGAAQDQLVGTFTVQDPAVAARTATDTLTGNGNQTPCTLTVAPNPLNFGNVNPNVPTTRQLTLTNGGSSSCNITGIALGTGTDPFFTLQTPSTTSLTVAAGGNATIGATFNPTAATNPLTRQGTLVFQSNDPAKANVSVPLTGTINNTVYSSGWPKWHYDNFNTGQSPSDTSKLSGTVAWKFSIGAPTGASGTTTYINSPVVDTKGNIYQVSMTGTLFAISPTGTKLWKTLLNDISGDPHPSTPAILKSGSMYVPAGSDATGNNLFFVSDTGSILSQMTFGEDGFDSSPGMANDGTLFLSDDDGAAGSGGDPYSVIAFTATGNTVNQQAGLALPLNSESERFGVVIGNDDTSYWGNNGQFFAVTPPSQGFQLASAWPSGGVTLITPYVTDPNETSDVVSDLALDAQVNNHLYAYSAWEDATYDANYNLTGYTVQGNLTALNPANGATIWSVSLPSAKLPNNWTPLASDCGNAAPAIAYDGTVYVGNGDGLRAIDGATGAVKWLFKSGNVSSSPAIGADGTIFYGASGGYFYAVHPNGTLRFKVQTGGPISASPAIADDGSVYFVSDDGNLYAIH